MKLMKRIGILFLALAFVWSAAASTVLAQSVADRRSDYQRDLDIYRDAHAQFVVKKSEFQQFGTFASEDALIDSAQQVLLARDDVWIAYWKLLSAKFETLTDRVMSRTSEWQGKFETEIEWLEANKIALKAGNTRKLLLAEAVALNNKADDLGSMSFDANSEISVSTLVQTTKSLLAFNQGLDERVKQQQLSVGEKETKTRGLAVNAERIQSILTRLEVLRTEFVEKSGYATAESFTKITEVLDPLYTEINQQYQVAKELSTGVEW